MQANQIVDVRTESDVYVAGNGEDGPVHGTRHFVVVETKTGDIFAHVHAFNDCAPAQTDDGETYWAHVEAAPLADALARKVQAHVSGGNAINLDHWYHRRTAYGSNAYLAEVAGMSKEQRAA
jgi:hypothetical protein